MDEESVPHESSTTCIFECPNDSCTKRFSSQKSVDAHIQMGNCTLQGVNMNISERAKRLYADKILSILPQRSISLNTANTDQVENRLQVGWAIRETKARVTTLVVRP